MACGCAGAKPGDMSSGSISSSSGDGVETTSTGSGSTISAGTGSATTGLAGAGSATTGLAGTGSATTGAAGTGSASTGSANPSRADGGAHDAAVNDAHATIPDAATFNSGDAMPTIPSSGCGNRPPEAGASPYSVGVTIAGTARTYKVSLPAGYDANTPIPLTVVFHGAGGNADVAIAFGLQTAAAAAHENAIFAFP